MPTPKNGFQILNLHPKKHVLKKKTFFNVLLPSFTKSLFKLINTMVHNKLENSIRNHVNNLVEKKHC